MCVCVHLLVCCGVHLHIHTQDRRTKDISYIFYEHYPNPCFLCWICRPISLNHYLLQWSVTHKRGTRLCFLVILENVPGLNLFLQPLSCPFPMLQPQFKPQCHLVHSNNWLNGIPACTLSFIHSTNTVQGYDKPTMCQHYADQR